MIADAKCHDCGRGVMLVGGMVRHAWPECPTFVTARASTSRVELGAYVEACPRVVTSSAQRANDNRALIAAKRIRAGAIGALEVCICGYPVRQYETSTNHDELCPSHTVILSARESRDRELAATIETIFHKLEGAHCALTCACRVVDVALNGGV